MILKQVSVQSSVFNHTRFIAEVEFMIPKISCHLKRLIQLIYIERFINRWHISSTLIHIFKFYLLLLLVCFLCACVHDFVCTLVFVCLRVCVCVCVCMLWACAVARMWRWEGRFMQPVLFSLYIVSISQNGVTRHGQLVLYLLTLSDWLPLFIYYYPHVCIGQFSKYFLPCLALRYRIFCL
jgi:hypothetical protein